PEVALHRRPARAGLVRAHAFRRPSHPPSALPPVGSARGPRKGQDDESGRGRATARPLARLREERPAPWEAPYPQGRLTMELRRVIAVLEQTPATLEGLLGGLPEE